MGVDYTQNADTRFEGLCTNGPLINTIDLSAVGGTTADANGAALSNTMNATKYIYIIRGTDPARVQASNMAVTDPGISLAEAATSIIYTKSADGTELISLGMDNTVYRNITVIVPAGSDTTTAEAQIIRIFGYGGSDSGVGRIAGLGRSGAANTAMNTVRRNTLSGTVTMDAPNWVTVATFAGEAVVFTGFQLDGIFWIIMTDNGPYFLDANFAEFRPLIDEIAPNIENGRGSSVWSYLGVIAPGQRATRFIKNLDGYAIGPTRFLGNTSPAQGFTTATCGSERWLWWAEYNPITADTTIMAARPRQPDDNHNQPLSFYTLATFDNLRCNFLMDIDTYGGRDNPTLIGGYGSNAFYITQGRLTRDLDDTNYRYASFGYVYLTELRRNPHTDKYIDYIELETRNCDANNSVTIEVEVDGSGTYIPIGYSIDTNGFHRLKVGNGETVKGRRFKPRIAMLANASTSAPQVIGSLTVFYREETHYHDDVI